MDSYINIAVFFEEKVKHVKPRESQSAMSNCISLIIEPYAYVTLFWVTRLYFTLSLLSVSTYLRTRILGICC